MLVRKMIEENTFFFFTQQFKMLTFQGAFIMFALGVPSLLPETQTFLHLSQQSSSFKRRNSTKQMKSYHFLNYSFATFYQM